MKRYIVTENHIGPVVSDILWYKHTQLRRRTSWYFSLNMILEIYPWIHENLEILVHIFVCASLIDYSFHSVSFAFYSVIKGWDNKPKILSFCCIGLWVFELTQLSSFFCWVLKLVVQTQNAAELFPNQNKLNENNKLNLINRPLSHPYISVLYCLVINKNNYVKCICCKKSKFLWKEL